MQRILYWARKDLRLHDNRCLEYASRTPAEILIVYTPSKEHLRSESFRQNFQNESVIEFQKNLQAKGLNLFIANEPAEKLIPKLIEQHHIDELIYQKEISSEEVDVESQLQNLKCKIKSIWQSSLILKQDLPFPFEKFPNGFTEFRKKVEYDLKIQNLVEARWANLKPIMTESQARLTTTENKNFVGGETAALDRLRHYFWDTDAIAEYKETRNGMLRFDDSSKFSLWLANGCLSPRKIYFEILRYEEERTQNDSTYWMFFELLWRDYFKFYAHKFGSKIFQYSGVGKPKKRHLLEDEELRRFEIWQQGQTGYPLVDACMRELSTTGWMSNRGRQNAASFLAKTLQVDWRWGAQHFEKYLLDHDVESNWGNWNYVAGVGTDPRDRVINVVKQSYDYDLSGDYIRAWVPELSEFQGSSIIEPWNNLKKLEASGYPERIL